MIALSSDVLYILYCSKRRENAANYQFVSSSQVCFCQDWDAINCNRNGLQSEIRIIDDRICTDCHLDCKVVLDCHLDCDLTPD